MFVLRAAQLVDIPVIEALIVQSVMVLQAKDYTETQRRGALGTVFGVDTQLIRDQTYFVIESDGALVACGGWSYRQTLYGANAMEGRADNRLDPDRDAARIRAFFVRPDWARRGLGSQILSACETAAREAGFLRFELGATLTGVPFYNAFGYEPIDCSGAPLPDGQVLPIVRMGKQVL